MDQAEGSGGDHLGYRGNERRGGTAWRQGSTAGLVARNGEDETEVG